MLINVRVYPQDIKIRRIDVKILNLTFLKNSLFLKYKVINTSSKDSFQKPNSPLREMKSIVFITFI
jgi:hypothetical protein